MIEEYRNSETKSKKIVRIILGLCIGMLVVLLGIKLISSMEKTVLFPIRRVQLYGNTYIASKEIMKIMHVDTDRSILFYNNKTAKEKLLLDGRISGVEIVKIFPETLKVYVGEKQKLFCLFFGDDAYWLSGDGTVLTPVESDEELVYPIIRLSAIRDDINIGKSVGNFMVEHTLGSLKEVKQQYPDFYRRIHTLLVNNEGISVRFKDNNYTVYLGNDASKERFEKLRALLLVLEKNGIDGIESRESLKIDLSFSHAAVEIGE
jgi:cell division septal protein FtsQ